MQKWTGGLTDPDGVVPFYVIFSATSADDYTKAWKWTKKIEVPKPER